MPRPSESVDVHPNDHQPSALPQKSFDVIAIGSGWCASVALTRLVKAGLSALLIEDELVGGECPFWACVPSKLLLKPQEALNAAAAIGGSREALQPNARLNAKAVFDRRDEFVNGLRAAIDPMTEANGIVIARGVGSIVGNKKVSITPSDGSTPVVVEARRAVILVTGSEPVYPNIPGLKESNVWTPRDATSASYAPDHLIILGAGAVGTEMAFAYASFGSKVTLVSGSDEIVPTVDPEAGKVVREALEGMGATVKVGSRAAEINRQGKAITVKLASGETITGSEVLLAAGRKPRSGPLHLENIGVKLDKKGFVPVGENLLVTGTDWLYAGGDVVGRALLTHTSKYHARIIYNNIMAKNKTSGDWSATEATADRLALPQVIFSHPPVASVGLTKKTAKAKGIEVREITASFASEASQIASENPIQGWAQWLVDEHNRLVGATMVGVGADDQIHASTVAVVGGLTLDQLMHAIPSFPSLSEVYLGLIDAAGL